MCNNTQCQVATVGFRWSVVAVLALVVFAGAARAEPAKAAAPSSISGVYHGSYAGEQGPIKFKLSITEKDGVTLTGTFTLYLPDGSGTKIYTCDAAGYTRANRTFLLACAHWATPLPITFDMPGLNGVFDPAGGNGAGQISGKLRGFPAPKFEAVRDATESAKMAGAVAANAPPAGPAAINGVYTGEFTPGSEVRPLKLSIKAADDGSLTALFTFGPPANKQGPSVTYKLTGKYDAGAHDKRGNRLDPFQFTTIELIGSGVKDASDASKANALNIAINPDGSISGLLSGLDYRKRECNVGWIRGTLDRTESADIGKVMAAQASAASKPAPAAVARLQSIDGVYNGTYTRAKGPPTKFKLTITHTLDGGFIGTAGMATIYLPTNSGTEAYTYGLKGDRHPASESVDRTGEFYLSVNDWVTIPPKDFEDFRGMGFHGKVVLNLAQNMARINSVHTQVHDPDCIPTFEATWDATESADIEGAIAAQKAVRAADDAVAWKEHIEKVRNAPPKQLASNNLVRKSRKYWDGYQTDMIREVFDGGFGAAIDENSDFRAMFCTYVEMYSAKYAALLPPDHQSVTITRYSSKPDGSGGYIKTAVSTSTVEVDSRFAKKYRQFAEGLGSSGGGLGTAMAAMGSATSLRGMVDGMLAPLHDMQRFFANHDGKSAAMRQLTENFLRGVTGEPSLQQADGKIDGAQAETDKDLPPGRYARFVDAANAYFRERAKADPIRFGNYLSHDTALCQRLAELYQAGPMSRDEEYYYANDFEGRFYPIMGPRASCPDPAWPRLHPEVEKAVEQVR